MQDYGLIVHSGLVYLIKLNGLKSLTPFCSLQKYSLCLALGHRHHIHILVPYCAYGHITVYRVFLNLVHSRNNPTTDNIRELVIIYICSGASFESVAQ